MKLRFVIFSLPTAPASATPTRTRCWTFALPFAAGLGTLTLENVIVCVETRANSHLAFLELQSMVVHGPFELRQRSFTNMTTFVFDIDKTVAAAAYLAKKKAGGRISIIDLLKMMYDAERMALSEWHRPITGDGFAALPKGIILSRTYNLIKHEVMSTESDMVKWSQHFSPREGNEISVISEPDYDFLSQREKEVLDKAFDEITGLIKKHGRSDIADVLHKLWPEWQDPEKVCGKKSMPLDLKEILSNLVEDEDEVGRICREIQSVQSAKAALQTN